MTPADFVNIEALTFTPGQLIIVSGPDAAAVITLLMDARDAIIANSTPCLDPIDTRMTITYPSGLVASDFVPTTSRFKAPLFRNTKFEVVGTTLRMLNGVNVNLTRTIAEYDPVTMIATFDSPFPVPPAVGDEFSILPSEEKPYRFEYLAVTYRAGGADPKVVLVGNQFDRESTSQNPKPVSIDIDVVIDLLNIQNVVTIPNSGSTWFDGSVREVFSYMSKVYYYDTRSGEITFVKNQTPERF